MIELVKPEFIAGNEKRFSDFISRLNEKDKIALISHTDLDGLAAAKVTNNVINADLIKFVNYGDLNLDLVNELKKSKIKKIIFTDLFFKEHSLVKEMEKFAEILIIDHHTLEFDLNSERTCFLNAEGFCATYLCYYLFSKIQNMEKYDWLVACASIADYCYRKNQLWLEKVYSKYGDSFIIEGNFVRKNGKIWDSQYKLSLFLIYHDDMLDQAFPKIGENLSSVDDLDKYSKKILEEIDSSLKKFESDKTEIRDGFFWEVNPKYHIKSILINDVSSRYFNKTIIIAVKTPKVYSISARRQDGKVNTHELLITLVKGFENSNAGGHFKSAGGYIPLKDAEEFKKRLKSL